MRNRTPTFVFSCLLGGVTLVSAQAPPAKVIAAGREPTIQLGGLLQAQFEGGDQGDTRFTNGNDRFYLRRARLNTTGTFLQELDFRLEVELAGSIANTTGLRAQLTDAYINWNRYHESNVRFGQFKTPFGFEQLYSDPRLPSIERSLANDRLTLSRQIGVQWGGDVLERRFSYALGTFNGSGANNNFNDNNQFAWIGRISGQPWRGRLAGQAAALNLGADAYSSADTALSLSGLNFDSTPATADRDGLFTGKRHGRGLDLQLTLGPLEIWAESLRANFKPANRLPKADFDAAGGYLQATCFVWQRRLQVLAKYETFDPNRSVASDRTGATTLGLNYYIANHDLKLMLDFSRFANEGKAPQNKLLARLQAIF